MDYFIAFGPLVMVAVVQVAQFAFERNAFGAELEQFQSPSARRKALRTARRVAASSLSSVLSVLVYLGLCMYLLVVIQPDSTVGRLAVLLLMVAWVMIMNVIQKRGIQRSLWRQLAKQGVLCCRECGYNLTGNLSGVCPECGTSVPAGTGSYAD